jgi:hypothetical protein
MDMMVKRREKVVPRPSQDHRELQVYHFRWSPHFRGEFGPDTRTWLKTIVTQRLKLSGMRWSKAGAQTILNLRVILLSGVWSSVYRGMLASPHAAAVKTYAPTPEQPQKIAA